MCDRTVSVPYVVTHATPASGALASAPAPTTTEPTGDGIYTLPALGSKVANFGQLLFFGTGSAGSTGSAQAFLWSRIGNLWVATPALDLALTLGAAVGVAGELVTNSNKFVKTIVPTYPTTQAGSDIFSPATTNGIARVDFDLLGAIKLQVNLGVGTATNINALLRTY